MPGEIIVLVNPAARGGRSRRLLPPVLDRLRRGGRKVSVVLGSCAADALERARVAVARRPAALVAFGGDGLVHLAVQAVAGTGVPLGIVPAGTGNDIADALGIPPRDPLAAADTVLRGRVRTVDAATVGAPGAAAGSGEWFAGVVACGFDSRVNERANRLTWPPGMAKYLVALAGELRAFRPIPFEIDLDGEVVEREAMLVAVGNTRSYGAGMRVCPDALPDDGLLDVMILGAVPKTEFLRTFPRVYRGSHVGHPAVTVRRARRVGIRAPDVIAYADGERVGPAPLTCEIVPGALSVIV
ncbi:diacylglycerol kinase (ATP) [Streptosporangium becharense]|uniref:Diacylglycerol kinase (ATP) n=1 Tax=Streptosporangium becharense TaxID=1816182 RepID=A0A7W9ICV2_9ACTN|nr:YegS/Rv2252/BmrU family lipid kinase [Streptosporangium becharense]MBB2913727.1 diacylglycerol kinase (ATP) [Streptosporangium becharense]MBB5817808.1 diacylglycerol kinase (ATP) [Streptosporangium becharense]